MPELSRVPRIDVIVGVHSPTRPIERVVASALRADATVRVTVVVHNTDPASIHARLGPLGAHPRVRVVTLADGVRSPANAFNRGLELATGEFVSIIGSDDEFAPRALDAWLGLAEEAGADVVIAPIQRTSGRHGTAPRPRPGRTRELDGDRDRLFERAAPLGLIRRERFPDLRLTPGLPRGEDQAPSLHLWFSGASVAFDPSLPPYIEHDDQGDRVTRARVPLADDLRFLDAVEADPVFATMSIAARRAFGAKTIRVFLIDAIVDRLVDDGIDSATVASMREGLRRIEAWAPGIRGLIARRDQKLIRAVLQGNRPAGRLREMIATRARFRSFDALVSANLFRVLHRHAPLRSLLAQRSVARTQARREVGPS